MSAAKVPFSQLRGPPWGCTSLAARVESDFAAAISEGVGLGLKILTNLATSNCLARRPAKKVR